MAKRKQPKSKNPSTSHHQDHPSNNPAMSVLAKWLVAHGVDVAAINARAAQKQGTGKKPGQPRQHSVQEPRRTRISVADHLELSPMMHISTKDLVLEIQRRSMASVIMMVQAGRDGQDSWSGGVAGSPFLLSGLLNATVHEVQDAIRRRLESGEWE